MKKLYIYPTFDTKRDKTGNSYIKDFHQSFSDASGFRIVNRLPQFQVFSMILNLDADIFIIHWVDLIPSKPLGKLQFFVFLSVMKLVKLLGKDIVWVLHNKRAHRGSSRWTDYLMKFMAGISDSVITHSEEGVAFYRDAYPDCNPEKCHYIPHPVYSSLIHEPSDIKWDYIIWGTIDRRKSVLEFVRFAAGDTVLKSSRILICGRCRDEEYDRQIRLSISENMTYVNKFLSDSELADYISASRIVLFTYNPESVLSSGALIYTLNFMKPVIGPRVGSFADMSGVVSCYDRFDDIPSLRISETSAEESRKYIEENGWESFPDKFFNCL